MQYFVLGLEHGATNCCLKPIEIDELVEKIILACKEAGQVCRLARTCGARC